MDNDTYLHISTVINKLDNLTAAVSGTTVPTTTTKTNTDFVIGINKSIDAASGRTGVEYPPYSHNTLVTNKLDELAEAIAEGGGGGPGPTPVMGDLSVTENGEYLPASYNYDGFSSVSVDVPTPTPTPTAFIPEFSETLLIDNSNYNASFTFTDDYHNYDIVKVIAYNSDSQTVMAPICTTPSTLDKCFSFSGGLVCFDEFNSRVHCDYTQNNLTWTKSEYSRTCDIKEIYGIKCTNGTVVETTIYDHNSLSSPFVTVNYNGSFKDDFDVIFVCANSVDGDNDEIVPCMRQIYTESLIFNTSNHTILNRYNGYEEVTYTDNSLLSWYYFFVVGLKFIPTPTPTPTVFTPKFSETLLIDNSNYNASFTFTDDYHNYDIVKVIICNPYSGEIFGVIHTTPSTLDKCFSFAWGLVCFDRYDTSDHCDYTQNGLTWTISDQYRSSNCIIKEIYGIKCTNGTAVETTIHDHNSLSNPLITINYDGSFKDDFDVIFICANSTDGDADEIMPTINQIYTDTLFYRDSVGVTLNRYNNYNNITCTDNSLSSWYYFFVVGLKFIPST